MLTYSTRLSTSISFAVTSAKHASRGEGSGARKAQVVLYRFSLSHRPLRMATRSFTSRRAGQSITLQDVVLSHAARFPSLSRTWAVMGRAASASHLS